MAIKRTRKRVGGRRFSRPQKFQQLDGAHIDYRDPNGLLKFLTDRGKILSRRITGISAKKQRELGTAIKRARFLGLLPVGSAKRK